MFRCDDKNCIIIKLNSPFRSSPDGNKHTQRYPTVKVPFFDGDRHNQAADEQKVAVLQGDAQRRQVFINSEVTAYRRSKTSSSRCLA